MATETTTTTEDLQFAAERALHAAYEAVNAANGAFAEAYRAFRALPIGEGVKEAMAIREAADHLTRASLTLPNA